jgi:hypothetical protein
MKRLAPQHSHPSGKGPSLALLKPAPAKKRREGGALSLVLENNEEMFLTMKMKSMLAVPAMAFALAGFAFAGSYFTLADGASLTGKKLKAGEYEVSLKKDQAVITTPDGKAMKVAVNVQQAPTKFPNTAAITKAESGGVDLVEVDLGGTTDRLVFGK